MIGQALEHLGDAVLDQEGGEAVEEGARGRQDGVALSLAQRLDDGLTILDKQSPAIAVLGSKHRLTLLKASLPNHPNYPSLELLLKIDAPVALYRRGGVAEVVAHRQGGVGKHPWLTREQQAEVLAEASKGKWRTAQDARRWIRERFGVDYKLKGVYERLKCKPKVPRPINPRA
jgi:hypothetical protein